MNLAVDLREFLRFVLTGMLATIGNFGAVWLVRGYVPFEAALLAGIVAGVTISFLMSKWFAFESRSWDRASGEIQRFLLVYAVSCAVYWVVASVTGRLGPDYGLSVPSAQALGVLAGAGTMMVTSYLGHRFFTYRTYLQGADRLRGVS